MAYAILVVWNDGEEEYLHEGIGKRTAVFPTRESARGQVEFMKMGMSDECQSISVVVYHPTRATIATSR